MKTTPMNFGIMEKGKPDTTPNFYTTTFNGLVVDSGYALVGPMRSCPIKQAVGAGLDQDLINNIERVSLHITEEDFKNYIGSILKTEETSPACPVTTKTLAKIIKFY